MPNIQTFALPSPYDQQMLEAKRRQQIAEMLQQQANESIIPQQGRVASKINPLAGVAQMLSAGLAGYNRRKGDEAQIEANRQAQLEVPKFIEGLNQGNVSPDAALAASLAQGGSNIQGTAPTRQDMLQRLATGTASSNPYVKQLAGAMLPAYLKPEQANEYYEATEIVMPDGTRKLIQLSKTGGEPKVFEGRKYEKPEKPERPMVTGGMWLDPSTGSWNKIPGYDEQQRAIAAAGRGPEPLVQVMGPNNQPIYVPRSQAIGQPAFNPASLKQELVEANRENQKKQLEITAQDTLDTAASLLSHPGRQAATGASHFLSNIPGTAAKDFNTKLETFKAQTFVPMVSALKGMGQLSDAEGKKLSAAVGALDPSMSEQAFVEELTHVMDFLYKKGIASGLNIKKPDYLVNEPSGTANDIHSQAEAILQGTRKGNK